MTDLIRSGSDTRSMSSTVPPPSEGSRMPQSIRSVVDLPSPLGPRKPYTPPARTRRSRWSPATRFPKRRVSWRVTTAQPSSDIGVRGQPGLEQAVRIVDLDLDAEDEGDPLLLGLDVARGELGLRADLDEAPREDAVGERVHAQRGRVTDLEPAHLRLRHVGAQPYVLRVDEG